MHEVPSKSEKARAIKLAHRKCAKNLPDKDNSCGENDVHLSDKEVA
jgi:hypothetical protein